MKVKERLDEIVARRSLKIPGSNKRVTVYLGKPQQITEAGQTFCGGRYKGNILIGDAPKGEWICPYKITGIPHEKFTKSFYAEALGKDSIDALRGALMGISGNLDYCNPPLQWDHSWGFDPGFPVMLELYGLEHKDRILKKISNIIIKEMKLQSQRPRPAWVMNVFEKMKKGPNKSAKSKRHKFEVE